MGQSSRHTNNTSDSSQPQQDVNRDTNTVYHILSSQRRRHAIQVITEHGPLSRRELSEHVAARELDKRVQEITRDDRQATYVTLIQGHIPKLVDAGVIEYDERADTLTATKTASQYANVISTVDQSDLCDDTGTTGAVENIVNWVIGR